jgi:hypothetical protein
VLFEEDFFWVFNLLEMSLAFWSRDTTKLYYTIHGVWLYTLILRSWCCRIRVLTLVFSYCVISSGLAERDLRAPSSRQCQLGRDLLHYHLTVVAWIVVNGGNPKRMLGQ